MKYNKVYKPEYDVIAYNTLASKSLRGKLHVCSVLRCTKETLDKWMAEKESFKAAVEIGLIDGELRFREKLKELSLRPKNTIDKELILSLAKIAYGPEIEQIEHEKEQELENTLTIKHLLPKINLPDI